MRVIACCVLASGVAAADPVDHVSVDASEEIGVLSSTRTMVTAGYTRRLWENRFYVEARLGTGATTELPLWVLDARGGAGLVLAGGRRVEVLLGWRIGDTYLRGSINNARYSHQLLAVEVVAELVVALGCDWRLRVVPLAPTLLWNKTYGGTFGLELGIDRAL